MFLKDGSPDIFHRKTGRLSYTLPKIVEKITGKKCSQSSLGRNEFDEATQYMASNFYFILPEDDFTVIILSREGWGRGLVASQGDHLPITSFNLLFGSILNLPSLSDSYVFNIVSSCLIISISLSGRSQAINMLEANSASR